MSRREPEPFPEDQLDNVFKAILLLREYIQEWLDEEKFFLYLTKAIELFLRNPSSANRMRALNFWTNRYQNPMFKENLDVKESELNTWFSGIMSPFYTYSPTKVHVIDLVRRVASYNHKEEMLWWPEGTPQPTLDHYLEEVKKFLQKQPIYEEYVQKNN